MVKGEGETNHGGNRENNTDMVAFVFSIIDHITNTNMNNISPSVV